MVAYTKYFGMACLVFLAAFFLITCGTGDSGGPVGDYNPVWIYIDTNFLSTLTDAATVELRGHAYCDTCPPAETAFGYCPSVSPPQQTSVDLTWSNTTTGESGTPMHAIVGSCSCFFSYCTVSYSHIWVVYYLPLTTGENSLVVAASYVGITAADNVTVTRVPQMVTGLTAIAVGADVELQWDVVPDATSYNIYWSTDPAFTRATATVISGVSSPYTHTGLSPDVTHYYLVTALNGTLESAASAKVFATPGWPVTVLDTLVINTEVREASLAIDSTQAIHVHYAFDECLLYSQLPNGVTYCSQYVWLHHYLTNLTGSPVAQQLSSEINRVDANIVLTSDETPHVSYIGGNAVHSWLAGGLWPTETVDAAGWCGTALAVAADDGLHLAYFAETGAGVEIRHAVQSGGAWFPETVSFYSPSVSCSTQTPGSLAAVVDSSGTVWIAYAGFYPDYGLFLAHYEGGAWQVETITTDGVQNLALAVDAAGRVHIASVRNDSYLWITSQDANGTWISTTLNDERASGQPSLAVDADGRIHVAYIGAGYQLRYAMPVDTGWRILALDGNAQSGADLAVDTHGKVHIVFFGSGQLKYVTNH